MVNSSLWGIPEDHLIQTENETLQNISHEKLNPEFNFYKNHFNSLNDLDDLVGTE